MCYCHRFAILTAGCDLNACTSTPGRFMQMASVHVGTDTDYAVSLLLPSDVI